MTDKRLNTNSKGVVSALAQTRDGQPLSLNRAPAPDLAPWVARVHATKASLQEGQTINCGLFCDTSFLRVLLDADWHAETRDGPQFYSRSGLLFGPQSKRMPVSVCGSFATAGIALMPGVLHALNGPLAPDLVDRIIRYSELGLDEDHLLGLFKPGDSAEQWMATLEQCVRQWIEQRGGAMPDPITQAFDAIAFANPNIKVRDFAAENGIEAKQLERVVKRDFGLSPKKVLRRARALDMAAHLRGVADAEEAEELALRYFDQSHLNHEFVDLLGITPLQFVRTPQPLMTVALEYRQARRVEALKRVSPDAIKPWQGAAPISRTAS